MVKPHILKTFQKKPFISFVFQKLRKSASGTWYLPQLLIYQEYFQCQFECLFFHGIKSISSNNS